MQFAEAGRHHQAELEQLQETLAGRERHVAGSEGMVKGLEESMLDLQMQLEWLQAKVRSILC